jgi:hypothetical protein
MYNWIEHAGRMLEGNLSNSIVNHRPGEKGRAISRYGNRLSKTITGFYILFKRQKKIIKMNKTLSMKA